jgi:hypothetical protein
VGGHVARNAHPEAAKRNGTSFDALVVDEGQDFAPTWWTALQLLLDQPDTGPFNVFADTVQAIYRPDWAAPFIGLDYELSVNCRNTLPIAQRVASAFDSRCSSLGAAGPDPHLCLTDGPGDLWDALKSALHRVLVVGRLRPPQVAVLSTSRQFIRAAQARGVGPHRLVPADAADANSIVAETVHRFKGLEADAVILVVPESDPDTKKLLYIGLSRARAYLELICPYAVASSIGWRDQMPLRTDPAPGPHHVP